MSRKLLCIIGMMALLLPPRAEAVGTSAVSAVLMDAESGRILYSQNADQPRLIASITKIMTAVVALEEGELDKVYQVTAEDMAEGSSMYLQKGEKLTLETLLYGLMLPSGNDAALAVAHCVSGDLEDFVEAMNRKAEELGMENSSFANPNGLDHEDHYSTARDMAILTRYALENETFRRIVSTKSITIGGRTMTNHNKLLSNYEGCLGVKTGYTKAAGRTLVSAAERDGQTLIAVTLCDGNDWADHQALFDYGFSTYPRTVALAAGESCAQVPTVGGRLPQAEVAPGRALAWPVSAGEKTEVRWELPETVTAPAPAGAVVGSAALLVDGEEVDRVELVLREDVLLSLALLPAAG